MSARMKKYRKELCFLSKCNKTQKNNYLKSAPSTLVHAVGDCAKTVLEGNLPISNYYRKKLRKHINGLKTLSKRSTSIVQKKRYLKSQVGGNIFSLLWKVVSNLF